jgi:hypothetical protein
MRAFPVILPNHDQRLRSPFGQFSLSASALSLTQPNHGHFGTVVRSPPDQWVMRCQLDRGFESAALKRSEQGSNNSIRYGCRADKDRAPRGVAGADRRGARQGRIGQATRAGRLTVASSPRVAEHGRCDRAGQDAGRCCPAGRRGRAPRASGRPQRGPALSCVNGPVPGAHHGLWCIGHVKHLEVWVTRRRAAECRRARRAARACNRQWKRQAAPHTSSPQKGSLNGRRSTSCVQADRGWR